MQFFIITYIIRLTIYWSKIGNATHEKLEQLRIKGSKSLALEKLEKDALEAQQELNTAILPK